MKMTTFVDPRIRQSIERDLGHDIPDGWEADVDGQGLVYFINHRTKTTQRHPPWKIERKAMAKSPDYNTLATPTGSPNCPPRHSPALSDHGYAASDGDQSYNGELSDEESDHGIGNRYCERLPPGWERHCNKGAVYYTHVLSKRTTWCDPRICRQFGIELAELPLRWDVGFDSEGLYLIDHGQKLTTRDLSILCPDNVSVSSDDLLAEYMEDDKNMFAQSSLAWASDTESEYDDIDHKPEIPGLSEVIVEQPAPSPTSQAAQSPSKLPSLVMSHPSLTMREARLPTYMAEADGRAAATQQSTIGTLSSIFSRFWRTSLRAISGDCYDSATLEAVTVDGKKVQEV